MHYRHTQVGWAVLGSLALVAILALNWLPAGAASAAGIPLLITAALVLLVFCSLTVAVDREAIRLRLGIGLVRKRIGLADVSSWRAVRQPWYTGWGIRLGPGYVLWNVSGFDAVELVLVDGRRFRVGTDQPGALTSALSQAKGVAAPPAPPDELLVRPRARVGTGFVATGFEVDTLFCGRSVPATDIVGIFLESALPRVLWKSNGFAGAGTRRGRFQVEGLGEGHLYVEDGIAPYLVVRLRQGFVIVNFREPERTRALFEEMARVWPDRAHR